MSGHARVEMAEGTEHPPSGDVFAVPSGHDAWVIGDGPWISIDFAGRRLFAKSPAEVSERTFTTIVFTDLTASTQTLSRMGDSGWRALLCRAQRGRAGAGRAFRRPGGQNDGRRVPRDVRQPSPRGTRRFRGCSTQPRRRGFMARAGVHTGEVELQGDDVRGITVHAAARILGSRRPGAGAGVRHGARPVPFGREFTDLG